MQDSPIVLTTLAGLSTGLGGLLAVLCPPTERLLAASAGFAGGVMLTASLTDLMPEALAFYGGYLPPLACGGAVVSLLALGMLTAGLLGRLLPGHVEQPPGNVIRRDAGEVIPLAAAQNRDGNLLHLGGG